MNADQTIATIGEFASKHKLEIISIMFAGEAEMEVGYDTLNETLLTVASTGKVEDVVSVERCGITVTTFRLHPYSAIVQIEHCKDEVAVKIVVHNAISQESIQQLLQLLSRIS